MRQSERNLNSAYANYREGIYEEACFESHQAAEKAVKALLNYFHRERRGYSILYLISTIPIEIPEDVRKCILELDRHYIPTRYPDVYDEGAPFDYYSREDADRCLECAKKIIDWVKSFVK